jgi:hypothetical protein
MYPTFKYCADSMFHRKAVIMQSITRTLSFIHMAQLRIKSLIYKQNLSTPDNNTQCPSRLTRRECRSCKEERLSSGGGDSGSKKSKPEDHHRNIQCHDNLQTDCRNLQLTPWPHTENEMHENVIHVRLRVPCLINALPHNMRLPYCKGQCMKPHTEGC